MKEVIKNKKVLLVGLGCLAGGLNMAKFLVKNGSKLTITDTKSEEELQDVIKKLKGFKINFVLGKHYKKDFRSNDIIVFNAAVSMRSPWVETALKHNKPIENDYTLFLKTLQAKIPDFQYIAITGTRGKTTTTFWTHHFLKPAILGVNIPQTALFKILDKILKAKGKIPIILETSSFHLEFVKKSLKPPKIAVITNFYNDHLNRYGNMWRYAKTKTKIFLNQTKEDYLILNYDDKNKEAFLKRKPKSRIFYVSLGKLPEYKNGLFFENNKIYFQNNGIKEFITEVKNFSPHQKYNLLSALLASHLWGKKWKELAKKISSLPIVPFRQEIVLRTKNLTIINDSAATSPDATIAALKKFGSRDLGLISGGTDKNLDFKNLAGEIKKTCLPENVYLLNGSATKKILKELIKVNYFKSQPQIFENLGDAIVAVKKNKNIKILLFSPAAASFEKFKNEFDRGKKFNKLIRRNFKQPLNHQRKF